MKAIAKTVAFVGFWIKSRSQVFALRIFSMFGVL